MSVKKLYLFNSSTRTREEFIPLDSGRVGMYACGPTVYARAHLGNARPVVVFDVLFRILQLSYEVTYVRNITDIDDKIILAAQQGKRSIEELTCETTALFHQDMDALGNLSPTHEPRATAYVDSMIAFIQRLVQQGYAYEAAGHVLFAVQKQPSYGCLSRCQQDEMLAGARVEVAPYKKYPGDFVLWKPSSPELPGWQSPWGRGRPGWHIECSAMSHQLLGETFDIHAGGQDLLFPHHENEIAQSTAAFGKGTFAQTWIHNGILKVNGEKMSKSLNNFITVEDLLGKGEGEAIRFAILSTHYRQALDWTDETLPRAQTVLDKFYNALRGFSNPDTNMPSIDPVFQIALYDDLNTPAAIARLHEIVHEIHTASSSKYKVELQACLKQSARLMGLLQKTPEQWFQKRGGASLSLAPQEIEKMIKARQEARKAKNFGEADQIRQQLLEEGVLLEDTAQGTTWRRV